MEKEEFYKNLQLKGYRLTQRRQEIIDYLFTFPNRYIAAREIIEYLQSKHATLSFETVYRNLHTLRDEGLLVELQFGTEAHYRIPCTIAHHHHFVCLACGRTYALLSCPMSTIKDFPEGFEILYHRFEIFGLCADCQKAEQPTLVNALISNQVDANLSKRE
ncbi:transcriptional repressor [Alicyclobacillaceae bacterium I2511]|nr:transcriptional repressor [Alicyclobacillaceae bacterium I2511]